MTSVETKDKADKATDPATAPVKVQVPDATLDDLFGKPKRVHSFTINLPTADGETVERKITYQAISGKEFDKLLADHPPKGADREKKLYNAATFEPALIAAVSLRPKMTEAQVEELLALDSWAAGEQATLFGQAYGICNADFSVAFSASA